MSVFKVVPPGYFMSPPIIRMALHPDIDSALYIASAQLDPRVAGPDVGKSSFFYGRNDMGDSMQSLENIRAVSRGSGYGDAGKIADYFESVRKSLPVDFYPYHVNLDLAGLSARVLTGQTSSSGLFDPLAVAIPGMEIFSSLGLVNIGDDGKLFHPENFEFLSLDEKPRIDDLNIETVANLSALLKSFVNLESNDLQITNPNVVLTILVAAVIRYYDEYIAPNSTDAYIDDSLRKKAEVEELNLVWEGLKNQNIKSTQEIAFTLGLTKHQLGILWEKIYAFAGRDSVDVKKRFFDKIP